MDNNIGDIIEFYSEHNVSENIKQRFFERITSSAYDRETDAAFRKLWNQAEVASMSDDEIESALHRFDKSNLKQQHKGKRTGRTKLWRIAAVIVPLLLLAAMYHTHNVMSSRLHDAQSVAMLQAHTISGEEKTLVLADGTTVNLYPGSVLLYPQNFDEKDRKVFLIGDAFFDIKHNDEKPFHVSTAFFDITDLGTSFGVTAYADAEEVSTTLKSGKIELRLADGSNRVYEMKPKERLVYNVRTKQSRMEQVDDTDDAAWKKAQIDLNDITLAEAARILERTYGKKIVFASNRFSQTRITIHYNRGEDLQGVMSIIADLIPGLKYEISQDSVVVK